MGYGNFANPPPPKWLSWLRLVSDRKTKVGSFIYSSYFCNLLGEVRSATPKEGPLKNSSTLYSRRPGRPYNFWREKICFCEKKCISVKNLPHSCHATLSIAHINEDAVHLVYVLRGTKQICTSPDKAIVNSGSLANSADLIPDSKHVIYVYSQ